MADSAFLEGLLLAATLISYFASTLCFFLFSSKLLLPAAKPAIAFSILGFLVHTAVLVLRAVVASRLPFANQYEFAASFSWGITLSYLVILKRHHLTVAGSFIMPIAFFVLGYAALLPREIRPLMPALRSSWLSLHVGSAVLAYGAFAVAFGLAVLFLVDESRRSGFRFLKDRDACDTLIYRVIAFGFLALTVVIVSGALWAQQAWSRYWAWDPKEIWSLVTWIIYALYLHLRLRRSWRGRPAAILAILGFLAVLFTFVGVNMLLPSIHSYI